MPRSVKLRKVSRDDDRDRRTSPGRTSGRTSPMRSPSGPPALPGVERFCRPREPLSPRSTLTPSRPPMQTAPTPRAAEPFANFSVRLRKTTVKRSPGGTPAPAFAQSCAPKQGTPSRLGLVAEGTREEEDADAEGSEDTEGTDDVPMFDLPSA
ncbi:hypothetical protein KIPB_003830 [Kipferlia bialata]|uniref:Uncharacterized protein n=1 Tax=Kipferlia bialata TaxID=797122 RepID=A0A391NN70_9EUKA|nr:hypothetical protein KIPB_003830 [Kipferlia bialata]|eukprot:g3830.t1